MKFYIIPPLAHMELSENKHNNFYCLAHLCHPNVNQNYASYKQFFIDKRKEDFFVTLDNGAAEGALVDTKFLIQLIKDIDPNEVIAPDILYNEVETYKKTCGFINHIRIVHGIHTNVMGVPQGVSPASWLRCYINMLYNPEITVIGLSKLAIPKAFCKITDSNSVSVNRRYVVKLLNELGLLWKPIHLLGMRNITEYKAYKGIPNIRSTDSCWTILAAKKNIQLDCDLVLDDVNETPDEYFTEQLDDHEILLAKENIVELARVIREV